MTQKEWLILAIFTLVIVLVWIVLDVYHAYTTSTVTAVEEQLMQPLETEFDHAVVIKLLEEN